MPDLTPSVLANLAQCFNSCVPTGGQLAVSNYLLAQIWKANDPMADLTPNVLMEGARCFNSCVPDGMQLALANYLLYQVYVSGGGGTGSGVSWYTYAGVGAPPAGVTDPFAKNTTTGIKYANLGTVIVPDWDVI